MHIKINRVSIPTCGWDLLLLSTKTFEIFLFGVGGALKLSASFTTPVVVVVVAGWDTTSIRASFCCKGGKQFGGSHALISSPYPGLTRTY